MTADKDRISIAERLGLTVEVEADAGITVEMPQFGVQLDQFQIRGFQEPNPQELGQGRRRYRQVYDLDIFLSGQYTVPAITAKYRDQRSTGGGTSPPAPSPAAPTTAPATMPADQTEPPMAELSTEPFTIEVKSLLEGEFDPARFRDVKPVAELRADRRWAWLWWTAGIGGAAVLAVAGLVAWRRRASRRRRIVVVPPHEWAFAQLRRLVEDRLIEAGQVKEFYYRLNEIVRTYVELRFGLMAPERTTEEFLRELGAGRVLPPQPQAGLVAFLEACDLVKYARYQPTAEEIERIFDAARDFVERTRRGEQHVEVVAA